MAPRQTSGEAQRQASGEAQRPEVPDPTKDIIKTMKWMSDMLMATNRVLHNNREVMARHQATTLQLVRELLQEIREFGHQKPSSKSSQKSVAADEEGGVDAQAELEMEDESQEQAVRREKFKAFSDLIVEYHRDWIDKKGHHAYITKRPNLASEAKFFFEELENDYLPSKFDNPSEHPLMDHLRSITPKSQVILYLHFNKGYHSKGTPAKSNLKRGERTAAIRPIFHASTVGRAHTTVPSSYFSSPPVFGSGTSVADEGEEFGLFLD